MWMKRIKAGALYYAIFISFFIALITGFMVLQQWYQKYYLMYVSQGERLERNIQSAFLVSIQHPELFTKNPTTEIDLFNDSLDMVRMRKSWWGGYQLLHADATWRVVRKTGIAMIGIEVLSNDAITLYLADEGKYLSLAGNTKISGTCYLPKLGLRKAYIEGSGYYGDKLVDGTIKDSKTSLPQTDTAFINQNRLSLQSLINDADSLMELVYFLKQTSIHNSFYNKTIKVATSSWLTIADQELTGNIKIMSTQGITIKSSSSIRDVIFYAPKIEIEKNFTGNLQCFVTDTLLIGEGCILKYPSLLALNETQIKKPNIDIRGNTIILGDITLIAKTDSTNVLPECSISENVVINGSLYCAGKVNLRGTIKGQLFCKGFLLKTPSSIYENHLLNATLNSGDISPYYSGSLFLTGDKLNKMIKCLE
jgi:cytoskeletal protein CcmA (bactofilin family)